LTWPGKTWTLAFVNAEYATLMERARDVVPRLRERARAAELARRAPGVTIGELQAAQLFDLQKPRRFGGFELGMPEFVDIVATVGRVSSPRPGHPA
jgi:hypothetical protein